MKRFLITLIAIIALCATPSVAKPINMVTNQVIGEDLSSLGMECDDSVLNLINGNSEAIGITVDEGIWHQQSVIIISGSEIPGYVKEYLRKYAINITNNSTVTITIYNEIGGNDQAIVVTIQN